MENEQSETNWEKMVKSVAQLGEKVWFRLIGEDDVSSLASRTTQEIWTRKTLSDACDSTNCDDLCDTSWQIEAPEWKFLKSRQTEKGRDLNCQKLWWKDFFGEPG